jgi:ribose 5-phosphate isomerase A
VVDVLAERLAAGALSDIVGVPTSRATETYAGERGIPLSTLDETPRLDVCIDGADEFDPALDLIKGLGGALLWEKIVASAADRLVIVVDEGKRVARLGTRAPLPVEVVPFGWKSHLDFFRELGARPRLREGDDGSAFVTDGGHIIVDLSFAAGIPAAPELELALQRRAGIVASGLFVGMASAVVVAAPEGTEVLEP